MGFWGNTAVLNSPLKARILGDIFLLIMCWDSKFGILPAYSVIFSHFQVQTFECWSFSLCSFVGYMSKTKWALLLVSSKNDVFTVCVDKQSDASQKQCKLLNGEGVILKMNHALAVLLLFVCALFSKVKETVK